MPDDAPHFDDQGRLIAPQYGDLYFSAEDGLAETRHVFLKGNRLAERFAAMSPGECFTIGETGFGTGLNFLAAWQCFDKHAPADALLDFVSVEGLPLDRETMRRALSPWQELGAYRLALLDQWGPIWSGYHRFRFMDGRVRLTLLVGDVGEVLRSANTSVDAWFLDGFAPSRNPEMWSDAVFSELARLSASESTLATYTAAGFVRRGLDTAGFTVEKQPGFGTKRDMTVGGFRNGGDRKAACKDVVVVGGSLAGAFAARALAERGVCVTLIERQQMVEGELPSLKPRVSVLQPKISDAGDANGRWLREGYAFVERWLASDAAFAQQVGWQRCGTYQTCPANHRPKNVKLMERFKRFHAQFEQSGLCRWVERDETEPEIGLSLPSGGLLVERAGLLRPAALCAAMLDHPLIQVLDGVSIESLNQDNTGWGIHASEGREIEASTVVLANAMGALDLAPAGRLMLKPVRGQVTLLDSSIQSGRLSHLKRALFFGGYLLPTYGGTQALGASFVPGDHKLDWRDEEHVAACEKLGRILSGTSFEQESSRLQAIEGPRGWVGTRTTTPSHRCYAEQIDAGLYATLGHGSHGIASAARAAEHLADLITGGVIVV